MYVYIHIYVKSLQIVTQKSPMYLPHRSKRTLPEPQKLLPSITASILLYRGDLNPNFYSHHFWYFFIILPTVAIATEIVYALDNKQLLFGAQPPAPGTPAAQWLYPG